jgi:subtilisin family serine protease
MGSRWTGVGVVVLSAALTAAGTTASVGTPVVHTIGSGRTTYVTLITGDRVVVPEHGTPGVEPGPGRKNIGFGMSKVDGRLTVIPADVRAPLAAGRLDPRLFDVTGLIESGYDDAHTTTIPVLVQHATQRSAPTGLREQRRLDVVDATAGKVDKRTASTFLAGAAALRTGGQQKVWLDGKRKPLLDKSVPQIGGPVAWQAGFTGKGVRIAVLDSGIDATHPDLADRVKGVFNLDGQPGDQMGHGTHVASIVAGTGAASGGRYRGVAPDADLYDGKVCTLTVCSDSTLIAGMEWAANDVKAQIVNISLGNRGRPADDPVEQALNTLTAQTGTLFVVAAGNDGEQVDGKILSPGGAAAALTVGAVDREDQLASFSSRGPGRDGTSIKPELTAPGVGIVAARGSEAIIGDPVDDHYLRDSGTSMATPHVAGAAALLAQQHPDWKAPDLKSALMASAKPTPGLTVFEQGTGRVDVARAITQTVVAAPATISFGTASWPHTDDEPVTKDVTYYNKGTAPVTLQLTGELTDPDGGAAPTTALTLSTDALTIPAGGSATVQVTSATNHNGPDGRYAGELLATTAGQSVRIPLTVMKDVEAHDLTIKTIGPDGTPAAEANVSIFALDRPGVTFTGDPSGTVTLRMRAGEYAVDSIFVGENATTYGLAQPSVRLTADTTVVLDAREARKVSVTVPRADAQQNYLSADYVRTSADGKHQAEQFFTTVPGGSLATLGQGPNLPADQLMTVVSGQWGVPGPDGDFRNTPYLYRLANPIASRVPTGYERTVRDGDLATVHTNVHQGAGTEVTLHGATTVNGYAPFYPVIAFNTPATVVEHLDAGAWQESLLETAAGDPDPIAVSTLEDPAAKAYRAGQTYRNRWNTVAFGPSDAGAEQADGRLAVSMNPISDADGHTGLTASDSESGQLYRDGTLVAEADQFGSIEAAGGTATYRYQTSLARASVSAFSERVDYTTTFRSADGKRTPLWTVGYRPTVDNRNLAERTPVTTLTVVPQAGASAPALTKVGVAVSGDGGSTWHAAAVVPAGNGTYRATFTTPAVGRGVSLRTTLRDAAGTTAEETTVNAYLFR